MTIEVRYHSRGGKTKRLAEAVAAAAGVTAKPVSAKLPGSTDLLFLCTAPYAFDVDPEVKAFIKGIGVHVSAAATVLSSAAVKSIHKYVTPLFREKHIALLPQEFSCRGEFLFLHKGRPNADDLEAAAEFARKVIAEEGSTL